MDHPDDHYDPDCDVRRFLNFSEPEPLPFIPQPIPPPPPPPTQQFAPPMAHELFVQPHPVAQWPPRDEGRGGGSGPSSPEQRTDVVVSTIEGIEGFSVEEGNQVGSNSLSPNDEATEEQIFQQFEPGLVDCSGCYVLREVLHSNASRNLMFVVHGGLGTFDHAIFDVEHFGEGNQPPRSELFYVELRSRTYEWVKNFLIGCIMLLKSDTTGVMHDSICSFYDALCGDINLYLSRGSYLEQAPASVPEPSSGSSSSMVGEGHSGFTGETAGAWGSSAWEAEGGSSSLTIREGNIGDLIRFLPQTNNAMQVANDGGSQFLSQKNNATQASHSPPSAGKRSWLAIQRERTANMGLSELASYLHLPMTEAAKELKLCSTALKHVCRRNGMPRWPSRQINAIDRQITRLQGELVRGSRRGGLFAIKEEIERLQARRARLYEGLES